MDDLALLPPRMLRKVEVTPTGHETPCWLWTGGLTGESGGAGSNGYGQVWFEGRNQGAHRVVYVLGGGTIPKGMTLDHLCRVHRCVRPTHLEPVTQVENLRRSPLSPGNRTHCPRDHEYSGDNVGSWNGHRFCKTCKRERASRRRDLSAKAV